MAIQNTAGDLVQFLYVNESVYGTTPTSALVYGGDTATFTPKVDLSQNYIRLAGSRGIGTVVPGPYKCGFNATMYDRVGYDWTTFFAVNACGAAGGLTEHLGSFSAQIETLENSYPVYNVYSGCKIDKLKISCDKPGMPLIFDIDVMAQWVIWGGSKSMTGFQTVTVGADPSMPSGQVYCWSDKHMINIAGGGAATFPVSKWSFTLENHLVGMPLVVTGADAYKLPLEAGAGISEGVRDIVFEYECPSTNETYTNSKLANQAITSLTVPVGAKTITLTDGVWEGNDLASKKQDLMTESGKIRFKSLTIA